MSKLSTISHVSEPEREEALAWLDAFDLIAHAKENGTTATAIVQRIARHRDCSVSTVWNKYRAFNQEGTAGLTDKRRRASRTGKKSYIAGKPDSPALWQKHVQDLYRRFQRKLAGVTVWETLLRQWEDWRIDPFDSTKSIPGWNTCPPADPAVAERHPAGWSLRNIQRMAPEEYDTRLSRQGTGHANEILPPVITTRVGLLPGQIYQLDDQHYDIMVNFGGKIIRPLGLNCLDLHSGCDIARFYRPRLSHLPDGQKEITERETLWFFLHILTNFGWRTDTGTVFIVENAKATVRQSVADALFDLTDGKVQVHRGAISGEAIRHFGGPAKGNPRWKAARESWFNLLRNRMAMLPGQTGLDPEHAPEEMSAHLRSQLVRYHQKTLDEASERLPIELILQLKLELFPWNRFVAIADTIAELAINQRTHHQLEGYKASGYETVEYRQPDGQWITEGQFLALPSNTQQLIGTQLRSGEKVARPRLLSPREVWDQGTRTGMKRLDPSQWHLILPTKFGLRRVVPRNRTIVIQDAGISPEQIVLSHTAVDRDGNKLRALRPGENVILHLNPWRPDTALAIDLEGRPIGLLPRIVPQTRLDTEALISQYAKRNQLKADIGADAMEHAREIARGREQMVSQNEKLLRPGTTPDPTKERAAIRLKSRQSDSPEDPTAEEYHEDEDNTFTAIPTTAHALPTFPDDDDDDSFI